MIINLSENLKPTISAAAVAVINTPRKRKRGSTAHYHYYRQIYSPPCRYSFCNSFCLTQLLPTTTSLVIKITITIILSSSTEYLGVNVRYLYPYVIVIIRIHRKIGDCCRILGRKLMDVDSSKIEPFKFQKVLHSRRNAFTQTRKSFQYFVIFK